MRDAEAILFTKPWSAIFIDVALPDGSGLQVLERARAASCNAPALVLTVSHDPQTINRAFDCNARFLVKTGDWSAIERFVQSALSFESRIDTVGMTWAAQHTLSRTEVFVITAMAKGWSRAQIGEELDIRPATLKRHVANLLHKLEERSLLRATARLLREAAPP